MTPSESFCVSSCVRVKHRLQRQKSQSLWVSHIENLHFRTTFKQARMSCQTREYNLMKEIFNSIQVLNGS